MTSLGNVFKIINITGICLALFSGIILTGCGKITDKRNGAAGSPGVQGDKGDSCVITANKLVCGDSSIALDQLRGKQGEQGQSCSLVGDSIVCGDKKFSLETLKGRDGSSIVSYQTLAALQKSRVCDASLEGSIALVVAEATFYNCAGAMWTAVQNVIKKPLAGLWESACAYDSAYTVESKIQNSRKYSLTISDDSKTFMVRRLSYNNRDCSGIESDGGMSSKIFSIDSADLGLFSLDSKKYMVQYLLGSDKLIVSGVEVSGCSFSRCSSYYWYSGTIFSPVLGKTYTDNTIEFTKK